MWPVACFLKTRITSIPNSGRPVSHPYQTREDPYHIHTFILSRSSYDTYFNNPVLVLVNNVV